MKSLKIPKKLGLDIGNVLWPQRKTGEVGALDSTDDSYLEAPGFPGALEAVKHLVGHFDETYIISRVEPVYEERLLKWLDRNGYLKIIPVARVHFCQERHEKAPICEKLGITHFVDDRLEVLMHMATVPKKFWFRSRPGRELDLLHLVPALQIHIATTWEAMLPVILDN